MSKFGGSLYKAARTYNTTEKLLSGNPSKIGNRAKNVAVGRGLARVGFWRRLWGRW